MGETMLSRLPIRELEGDQNDFFRKCFAPHIDFLKYFVPLIDFLKCFVPLGKYAQNLLEYFAHPKSGLCPPSGEFLCFVELDVSREFRYIVFTLKRQKLRFYKFFWVPRKGLGAYFMVG